MAVGSRSRIAHNSAPVLATPLRRRPYSRLRAHGAAPPARARALRQPGAARRRRRSARQPLPAPAAGGAAPAPGWTSTGERRPRCSSCSSYMRIDTTYTDRRTSSRGRSSWRRSSRPRASRRTIERMGERQANLWAVLEGEDPQALVLHKHIDIDPVDDPEHGPPAVRGRSDRAAVDLRARRLRHEERRRSRSSSRSSRSSGSGTPPAPLGDLPRHQQRGARQRPRHALDPARAPRAGAAASGRCSPKAASSRRALRPTSSTGAPRSRSSATSRCACAATASVSRSSPHDLSPAVRSSSEPRLMPPRSDALLASTRPPVTRSRFATSSSDLDDSWLATPWAWSRRPTPQAMLSQPAFLVPARSPEDRQAG